MFFSILGWVMVALVGAVVVSVFVFLWLLLVQYIWRKVRLSEK